MVIGSMLWRRLDCAGHDACRLEQVEDGWRLDGTAVFSAEGEPARLAYQVCCDRRWYTTRGSVIGWIGERALRFAIERSADGLWTVNGTEVRNLDGCVDLDLGFTPATNLCQLRRLALRPGESAPAPVAWLDPDRGTLEILHQQYERRTENAYWYEAPRFSYAALLEVTSVGFVRHYPGLWQEE